MSIVVIFCIVWLISVGILLAVWIFFRSPANRDEILITVAPDGTEPLARTDERDPYQRSA